MRRVSGQTPAAFWRVGSGPVCWRKRVGKPMQRVVASPAVQGKSAVWPLLIVGLGTLVVPLDSAVNIDFSAIVARFGLPIPMIQWVVIAYVLTQTSLMLTFGRI